MMMLIAEEMETDIKANVIWMEVILILGEWETIPCLAQQTVFLLTPQDHLLLKLSSLLIMANKLVIWLKLRDIMSKMGRLFLEDL